MEETGGGAALGRLLEMSDALVDAVRKPRHRELARVVHAIARAELSWTAELLEHQVNRTSPWTLFEEIADHFEADVIRAGQTLVTAIDPRVPLEVDLSAIAVRQAVSKQLLSALANSRPKGTVALQLNAERKKDRVTLVVTVTPGDAAPIVFEDVEVLVGSPIAEVQSTHCSALVVEPSAIVREGLARHLQHAGCEPHLTESIESAHDAVRKNRYDLALVDLAADTEGDEVVTRHLHASATPTLLLVDRPALTRPIFPHHHGLLSRPIPWSRFYGAVDAALGRTRTRTTHSSDLVRTDRPASPRVDAKILVVEDSDTNRRLMQRLLQHYGRGCDLAVDGLEAIERCRKVAYDLVFMDCRLPELDGYEATRRIRRELGPAPPIVALTGESSDDERMRCEAAGMNDFLPKPIDHTAVADVLTRFLG